MAVDAYTAINAVFHLYDPPLWLVTARAGARRGGFIATSATRASIIHDLPRMLLAVAQHHYTWGLIEASDTFALHLLAADDLESVRRFGLASGHRVDKFAAFPVDAVCETPNGSPLIAGAVSWLDCRVESRMDIGDRTTYVAEITVGAVLRDGPILTVDGLLNALPDTDRAEMKRLYSLDQDIDRAAIRAWRSRKGVSQNAAAPHDGPKADRDA